MNDPLGANRDLGSVPLQPPTMYNPANRAAAQQPPPLASGYAPIAHDPLGATGTTPPPPPASFSSAMPSSLPPPPAQRHLTPPPVEAVDPVREFLGESYYEKGKLPTLQPDLDGLRALARAGQFEQLVAVSEIILGQQQGGGGSGAAAQEGRSSKLLPHERLAVRHARLVSFMRLRRHDVAAAELDQIGEFDRSQYLYETYGSSYPPTRRGSFVPFSLRLLKAEMPVRLKPGVQGALDQTMDALLRLRGWCVARQQPEPEPQQRAPPLAVAGAQGVESAAAGAEGADAMGCAEEERGKVALWASREDVVTERLVSHATAAGKPETAITLLQAHVARRSSAAAGQQDVHAQAPWLSKLGRVYLQFGQLAAAEDAFQRAEAFGSGGDAEELEQELNAGLMLVARGRYSEALTTFDDLLELDPSNLLAANNKAISLLYTGQLKGAIAFLEGLIRADPERHLQNALVCNLSMMYDLAAHRAKERKRTLQQLAQRYASDDFDQTVLKLS